MNRSRRVVRFAMSNEVEQQRARRATFTPERAVDSSNVGIWLGLAAVLWTLIALPAFML